MADYNFADLEEKLNFYDAQHMLCKERGNPGVSVITLKDHAAQYLRRHHVTVLL